MEPRDYAEELAIGLELGFAQVEEAVVWADEQIVALDEPPYELIEVSSACKADPLEMAHLLRNLPGDVNVASAVRRVIARMSRALDAGETTPEQVARALSFLDIDERWPDTESQSDMARLNEAFELAHEGTYGTVEEATGELREFLDRFTS